MKKKRHIFLFFILFVFIPTIKAQTDTVINGKKYKIVEESAAANPSKPKKRLTPLDSTFVINNKVFKYYNNWLTLGGGAQQNLRYNYKLGFAGGVDFNFHIKQHYFQLGATITGERFGFYNNYQFHLGYGKRFENKDFHAAGFIGSSYSTGYGKVGDSVYTRPYKQYGLYGQIEIVKKITYDVGVGAALFADYNAEQPIIGLRFLLYFSGAYKGKKYLQEQ